MDIGGVCGKIVSADVGTGKVEIENVAEQVYLDLLGGYGMGSFLLYQRQPAGIDALAAESIFGLTTGPLTGTRAVTGNRFTAVGKSPKSGTWGDANCGGNFGPGLKFAGVDAVFLSGIAAKPMYVCIENGKASLLDATDLWGLDSNETEDKLIARHGKKARVACIGPAGERASLLACVMNDYGRAAGRSGLGALMGAKRVKAVVAVGDQQVRVADPDRLAEVRRQCLDNFKTNDAYENLHKYGTAGITAGSCTSADTPIKNWGGVPADFPGADKISDDSVLEYLEKPYGCWLCPIACGGHMKVKSGPYAGEGHKPEYETLGVFGTLCLNDSLESIIKLNDICNRAGLDTISAGATVAFAIECYENGIISKDDTDGIELKWGDDKAIVELTQLIAEGKGVGKIFENGIQAAAKELGEGRCAEFAMHVAGEELPMHDSRLNTGLATSYQVDATPGRHTQWGAWLHETGFYPTGADAHYKANEDKYVYTGKADSARFLSCYGHTVNAAGLCMFGAACSPVDALPGFLTAVMGTDFSLDRVIEVGWRIGTMRMAFTTREGVAPPKVALPGRMVGRPPLKGGPLSGVAVDFQPQTREYLEAMGWDAETAKPLPGTLKKLGIDTVVK